MGIVAAFTGCEKESTLPCSDSGRPFVIHVLNNNEATRGEEISSINSFNLVGLQGTSNLWIDNFLFTNPVSDWLAAGHEDICWPGGTDTHTFYATSPWSVNP